jgi:hypothetical protein
MSVVKDDHQTGLPSQSAPAKLNARQQEEDGPCTRCF